MELTARRRLQLTPADMPALLADGLRMSWAEDFATNLRGIRLTPCRSCPPCASLWRNRGFCASGRGVRIPLPT